MKRITVMWVCTMLIFSVGFIFTEGVISVGPVHNIDTDEYFNEIQTAIDDPDTLNGHTIEVANGIYYENVVIYKMLTIIGEDRDTTTIDGDDGTVIEITVNGVNIKKFTIRNNGAVSNAGIKLTGVQNCRIENCTSIDVRYGFLFWGATNNEIKYCNATNSEFYLVENSHYNTFYRCTANEGAGHFKMVRCNFVNFIECTVYDCNTGFYISSGSNIRLENCTSFRNNEGVLLHFCTEVTFVNNTIYDNAGDNLHIDAYDDHKNEMRHYIDATNTINGRPIYYFFDQENEIIENLDAGYIGLAHCSNMTLRNCSVPNGDGLRIFVVDNSSVYNYTSFISTSWGNMNIRYSNDNWIENCVVHSNPRYALGLGDSYRNKIIDCTFSFNGNYGISFGRASNNVVESCTLDLNGWEGIYFYDSHNNLLYHNNFINNSARDDAADNFWDDGYPSGGNYWSDYTGVDEKSGPNQDQPGSDGIGDTPYVIDADSQDNYPLMELWEGGSSPQPLMILTKWAPLTAYREEMITYWINYSNAGSDTAYDVKVIETYPLNVTFISSIPAPSVGNNIWYMGNLAIGASGSIQINVLIGNDTPTSIFNEVELYYNNSAGEQKPKEVATASTGINGIGIVHNIDTDEYFTEIQAAIDDSDTMNGHTIEVGNGTYYENVEIYKSINLIGEDKNTTIVHFDGENSCIRIDYTDGVTVSGFTVTSSNYSNSGGIYFRFSNYCNISDNIAIDCGIGWHYSDDNTIYNNKIINPYNNGISFANSNWNTIIKNEVTGNINHGAVSAGWVNNNTFVKNTITLNEGYGFKLYQGDDNIFDGNIISNNTVKPVCGILLTNPCNNNIIINNTISDNGHLAILLEDYVSNTKIYHNNIINNNQGSSQVKDVNPQNMWDNGYPSGGNYWSDYTGIDQYSGPNQDIPGSDGIGDTPYTNILGGAGAQDNYPLMEPWEAEETPQPEPPQQPSINITKWAPSTATPGETITYWINYSNTGDDSAYNSQITESYPPGVTFINSVPPPDVGDNVWIYEIIAPEGSGSIMITVLVEPTVPIDTWLINHVDLYYENATDMAFENWAEASTFVLGVSINTTLSEGWNLVSLPFIQDDTAIDEVLASIWDKWDAVMIYDPLSPTPWKSNLKSRHWSFNNLWELDHTMGIWINITEPNVTLTVNGTIPVSTSIPLYAGWNLVGYPTFNETMVVADALWGTGADKVAAFDSGELYNLIEVDPTYVMKPGEGYWVHVPFDTVWVVDW